MPVIYKSLILISLRAIHSAKLSDGTRKNFAVKFFALENPEIVLRRLSADEINKKAD
jgi:hypothetical protein